MSQLSFRSFSRHLSPFRPSGRPIGSFHYSQGCHRLQHGHLQVRDTPLAPYSTQTSGGPKTWEMKDAQLATTLRVNQNRLMRDLHHTCQWGTGHRWGSEHATETGMSRLALSDADKQARDWFGETTSALGCKVTVDEMGNMFAVRRGGCRPEFRDHSPTVAGSHLDTQPSGGRYDGILGVHAGVEMLRVLEERGVQTAFPVGVVNWTK